MFTEGTGHQFLAPRKIYIELVVLTLLITVGAVCASEVQPQMAEQRAEPSCVLTNRKPDCLASDNNSLVRVLPLGTLIEESMTGGERHFYEITLAAGQFVRVVVHQQGIDVSLSICSPQGEQVAEVDRQNGSWGAEAISHLAKTAGVYRLRVRPLSSSAINGRYSVRIKELREPSAIDEVRITAEKLTTTGGKFFDAHEPDCLRRSIESYEHALRLWQSLDELYEQAVVLYGLGWSYSELGSHGMVKFPLPLHRVRWSYESREAHFKSIKYFEQAHAMMKNLNDPYGESITQAGIAWSYLYVGNNMAALENFSRARQFFKSNNNKRGVAITVYGLGWVHAILNENQKALDCFLEALPLRREVNDVKGEAITLIGISRMQSRLGQNSEALKRGWEAFDLFKKQSDPHGMASAQFVIGWAHRALNQLPKAFNSFQMAADIEQQSGDTTGEAAALYGIACVLSEQGDLTGAVLMMQRVLGIIEPLREKSTDSELRTYYFANVQEYYDFYIDLLMRQHQLHPATGFAAEALSMNERARARELLAILAESGNVNAENLQLTKGVNTSDIQALLDDRTLLLEYFLGKERSYLWLVSSKGLTSYQLPNREEIESRAIQMHRLLAKQDNPEPDIKTSNVRLGELQTVRKIEAVAQELGKLLLGPVGDQLGTKRLVIVTQGALQMVPFSVLSLPSVSRPVFKPLVEDHEIIALPSASVLKLLKRSVTRPKPLKQIAVVADPVFTNDDIRVLSSRSEWSEGGRGTIARVQSTSEGLKRKPDDMRSMEQFRRLFGSRWEARQIISLVPPGQGLLVLDFAATKQKVMAGALNDYRIIHFATHAIIDDTDPALSRIVLSHVDERGNPENGDLFLSEISQLNVQADLVVLNACRTGLGPDVKGEGLIGLMGGFMQAGTPQVLVSLWSIDDKAAAEFMVRFYRKVLSGPRLSPTAALREVQVEMWRRNRWPSIYHWAAFTLHGDWTWNN